MSERKQKIIFYYHHFGGLGHGTRIAAICRELQKMNRCDILILNSGRKQPELNLEAYATVINLPYFDAREGLFKGLQSKENNTIRFQKRKEILVKVLQRFKPDTAVIEHFPFGRSSLSEEIELFIALLKERDCRVYSSVRDIIDQKVDENKLVKNLKLFDGILVHTDQRMGFDADLPLIDELKNRMYFTGRVSFNHRIPADRKNFIRQELGIKDKKMIVISVGGGIDGEQLIAKLINAKKILDKEFASLFLIAVGPSMNEDSYDQIMSLAKQYTDITVKRFFNNYWHCVNAADFSITMGGYNSVNNALLTETNTLIFPRSTDNEQKKRVSYFREYVNVADQTQTENEIADKIISLIDKPKKTYPYEMSGAQTTARLLDTAGSLQSMKIRLDTECNLTCEMCSWKKKTVSIPENSLKQLVNRARLVGIRIIAITGGEPTMLPEIKDHLKYIKEAGLRVSLSTNGYLSAEILESLIPYIDYVDISIDSAEAKLHDRIRGKIGAFDVSFRSIQRLAQAWIPPHINVTVRPDNIQGLSRLVPAFAPYSSSMSFTLVDTTMIKKRTERYIFSDEQLEKFYFDELITILKECSKNRSKVRIRPFFQEFAGQSADYILRKYISDIQRYKDTFRTIFHPNHQKCFIPKNYLRVNPSGNLVFCCFQDDSGLSWGNVFRDDLCDLVVSDQYQKFSNNASEGDGLCDICKKTYHANYGGEVLCAKSAS